MPCRDYPFIHPLLGTDDAWSGYRVEFAPGSDRAGGLAQLLRAPGLAEFDQRQPWFFPVWQQAAEPDESGLRHVTVFPSQTGIDGDADWSGIEAELRRNKQKIALHCSPDVRLPGAGAWDYLLISTSHARSLPPFTLQGIAYRTTVVATDVHTHNDRDWILANGCALSSDEYLLTRAPGRNKADMTRLKLLKLLAMIDDEASTQALETVFREESKLSYSLLRLVNSAALAPPNPITGYGQAINMLGRRQLQRWLQLLVFSDPNDGQHPTPLLQKAAARGHLLESLATYASHPDSGLGTATHPSDDTAFMIGTFSLLDVLLNIPLPEILLQLPLPEIVRKSLLTRDTPHGQILSAIEAADRGDRVAASKLLKALAIDAKTYLDAQLAAFAWASKIRSAV